MDSMDPFMKGRRRRSKSPRKCKVKECDTTTVPWNISDAAILNLPPINKLNDVQVSVLDSGKQPQVLGQAKILTTNFMAFDIFTSEQGKTELERIISDWIQTFRENSSDSLVLWNMIDAYFNAMPLVCCSDKKQLISEKFVRYASMLEQLKQVIRRSLYVNDITQEMKESTLPLYLYCQELRQENERLKKRLDQQPETTQDVGLVSDAASNVLLEYWKLKKQDRLSLLIQIFASKTDSTSELVRVLIEGDRKLMVKTMEELGYVEIDKDMEQLEKNKAEMEKILKTSVFYNGNEKQLDEKELNGMVPLNNRETQTDDVREEKDPWAEELKTVGQMIAEAIWMTADRNDTSVIKSLQFLKQQIRSKVETEQSNMTKKQVTIIRTLLIIFSAETSTNGLDTSTLYQMEELMTPRKGELSTNDKIKRLVDFSLNAVKKLEVMADLAQRANIYLTKTVPKETSKLAEKATLLDRMAFIERSKLDALPEFFTLAQKEIEYAKTDRREKEKKVAHIPLAYKKYFSDPEIEPPKDTLPLHLIHEVIFQIYWQKFLDDQMDDRSTNFPSFIFQWHVNQYGERTLAERQLLKFLTSIRVNRTTDYQCQIFARFGIIDSDPMDPGCFRTFLTLLALWSMRQDTSSKLPTFEVEEDILAVFNDMIGVYEDAEDCVKRALKKKSVKTNEVLYIDQNKAIKIAIDGWSLAVGGAKAMLKSVFVSGDVDGDNEMRYDEFCDVMAQISPGMLAPQVMRLFKYGSQGEFREFLTPEGFIFIMLENAVLREKIENRRRVIDIEKAKARPKTEGAFLLLEHLWETEESNVHHIFKGHESHSDIPQIKKRIALMRSLLKQRVDPEAAWMCHRMIMSELRRIALNKGSSIKKQSTIDKESTPSAASAPGLGRFRWAVKKVQQTRNRPVPLWSILAKATGVTDLKNTTQEKKQSLAQLKHTMRRSFLMENEVSDIGVFYENLDKLDRLKENSSPTTDSPDAATT